MNRAFGILSDVEPGFFAKVYSRLRASGLDLFSIEEFMVLALHLQPMRAGSARSSIFSISLGLVGKWNFSLLISTDHVWPKRSNFNQTSKKPLSARCYLALHLTYGRIGLVKIKFGTYVPM